jgi:circadian clock protein KaiB
MADKPEMGPADSLQEFQALASSFDTSTSVLRLYISGMTARSTEAINNLTAICEQHLKGRYELEVIDVYQHPKLTETDQIIATPTLIKRLPLPLRRLVGTLSDEERVLIGLNLRRKESQ